MDPPLHFNLHISSLHCWTPETIQVIINCCQPPAHHQTRDQRTSCPRSHTTGFGSCLSPLQQFHLSEQRRQMGGRPHETISSHMRGNLIHLRVNKQRVCSLFYEAPPSLSFRGVPHQRRASCGYRCRTPTLLGRPVGGPFALIHPPSSQSYHEACPHHPLPRQPRHRPNFRIYFSPGLAVGQTRGWIS